MDARTAFPCKYLKAADIEGKGPITLTIDRYDMEEMPGDEREIKPVIYFQGAKKGLVLNITNNNEAIDSFGYETDSWCGQQITLSHGKTDFRGKRVGTIILTAVASAPVPEPVPHESVSDDQIPF